MGYRTAMLEGLKEVRERVNLAYDLTMKERQPDLEQIWHLLLETVAYTNGVMGELLESCGAPFKCDPDANEMFQKGVKLGLIKARDACTGRISSMDCIQAIETEKEKLRA